MSMSVRCLGCGLEYAGGRRLAGLFPRAGNLARPAVPADAGRGRPVPPARPPRAGRGHRTPTARSASSSRPAATRGYFVEHFLLPVVSAVWSAPERVSRAYPARYLFAFLDHHGMLSVGGVAARGGRSSAAPAAYVERAAKNLTAVHVGTPVRAVAAAAGGVAVRDDADVEHHVDRRRARHARRPGAARCSPTRPPAERGCSARSLLPQRDLAAHRRLAAAARPARAASWNYLKPDCARRGPGAGQLPHEPADAAGRRRDLRGHPRRDRPGRRATPCSRGWSTSTRCTRRSRWPRNAGCPRLSERAHRRTRAPTTAGASTRTAAPPASGRRQRSEPVGHDGHRRRRDLRRRG